MLAWMIYMKFNLCNTVHKMAFSSIIITKNDILGFYSTNKVGTLWSVLYFYCNWQKKKKPREWEGMGVILPGVERDGINPPVFSWDWDGKRLKFVGRERFENSLPCHPHVIDGRVILCHFLFPQQKVKTQRRRGRLIQAVRSVSTVMRAEIKSRQARLCPSAPWLTLSCASTDTETPSSSSPQSRVQQLKTRELLLSFSFLFQVYFLGAFLYSLFFIFIVLNKFLKMCGPQTCSTSSLV